MFGGSLGFHLYGNALCYLFFWQMTTILLFSVCFLIELCDNPFSCVSIHWKAVCKASSAIVLAWETRKSLLEMDCIFLNNFQTLLWMDEMRKLVILWILYKIHFGKVTLLKLHWASFVGICVSIDGGNVCDHLAFKITSELECNPMDRELDKRVWQFDFPFYFICFGV